MTDKWYKDGLKFQCQEKCSNCCGETPGYVWLTKKDEAKIAGFFKISLEEFYKRYCRFVKGKYSLKENYSNFDCIFLKDHKCSIYEVRPIQCSAFPFWPNNLESKKNFDSLSDYCPGCNKGKVFSEKKIQETLQEFVSESENNF